MITKNIKDVLPNEVIGENIYQNELLIIRKGTKLTRHLISLLKRHAIKEIMIAEANFNENVDIFNGQVNNYNKQKKEDGISSIKKSLLKDNLIQVFSKVGLEYRYGNLMKEEADVLFLINLFEVLHERNTMLTDILEKLLAWDEYTYIHSFDTFILGTLMAKKHKIYNLQSVSMGYLLHDIGKLTVPQALLNKPGKLSYTEFEIVKKHTVEGEKILKEEGLNKIAHFARSHHERMNGSGYPDKLTKRDLSEELKILQIVDVYSALTLKRPYKKPISGQEALNTLFKYSMEFDENLLKSFVEELNIYPTEATVLLSDNTIAIIKDMNPFINTPTVKRLDRNELTTLPINYEVKVNKLIDFQQPSFQSMFDKFFNYLRLGNHKGVHEEFTKIIDGFKLEDIYSLVLLPAFWMLCETVKQNKLTKEEYLKSTDIIKDILKDMQIDMVKLNQYDFKVVLFVDEVIKDSMIVNFLINLLHLECIFPIVMDCNIPDSEIIQFGEENNVHYLCIISLIKKDVKIDSVNLNISNISYNELLKELNDISNLKGASFQIYNRIFNHQIK